MPLLCRVEKYFKVKGNKMEVEAPAQGAISAASFVKLWNLQNPILIYDLGCRIIDHIYRVFFSKGPTQKSSKYGIGPSQQDKITKDTGLTESYQRSKE